MPARNLAASIAPFANTDLEYAVCVNSITSSSPANITSCTPTIVPPRTADEYAWNMTVILIKEAMQVAKAMGLEFNEEEMIEQVRNTSLNSPEGRTSIYADLKAGRLTEVNTINGAVVKAGDRLGVPVPSHKMIVNMVHAMENKSKNNVE